MVENNAIENDKRTADGNMAAMREACQKMLDLLMLRGDGKVRCVLTWDEFNESQKMLRAALAKPARNCDVGTAEEQYRRHDKFCDAVRNGMSGYHCEDAPRCVFCFAKWAQMPY